jgi:Tc5 transposase DNA-binding domain
MVVGILKSIQNWKNNCIVGYRKNAKGLCVKDHCIQQKALNLFEELHPEVHAGEEFKASTGWLSNFK